MRKSQILILLASCMLFFVGCDFNNRVSKDISQGWKVHEGDSLSWAEKSLDDSAWNSNDL